MVRRNPLCTYGFDSKVRAGLWGFRVGGRVLCLLSFKINAKTQPSRFRASGADIPKWEFPKIGDPNIEP